MRNLAGLVAYAIWFTYGLGIISLVGAVVVVCANLLGGAQGTGPIATVAASSEVVTLQVLIATLVGSHFAFLCDLVVLRAKRQIRSFLKHLLAGQVALPGRLALRDPDTVVRYVCKRWYRITVLCVWQIIPVVLWLNFAWRCVSK